MFAAIRVFKQPPYLFLPFNDMRELGVRDPGVQLALHESRSFVVFDVSQVSTLRHFDVFGKALRGGNTQTSEVTTEEDETRESKENEHVCGCWYLLLEVADGVFISIREKIEDVVFDVVLLQVVHQVGTVALTSDQRDDS